MQDWKILYIVLVGQLLVGRTRRLGIESHLKVRQNVSAMNAVGQSIDAACPIASEYTGECRSDADIHSFTDGVQHFAKELSCFLEVVWNQRKTLGQDINKVYDLYNGGSPSIKEVSNELLGRFTSDALLVRDCCASELSLQAAEKYKYPFDWELLEEARQSESREKMIRKVGSWSNLMRNGLKTDYFLFYPRSVISKDVPITYRLYINIQRDSIMGNGLHVVMKILEYANSLNGNDTDSGLSYLKVGGLGTDRADSIVAYFTSEQAAKRLWQAVLLELPPEHFRDELPILIKRLSRGVGIAGEPGVTSVGALYSTLVVLSLQQQDDEGHFLRSFHEALRKNGFHLSIDPCDHLRFDSHS